MTLTFCDLLKNVVDRTSTSVGNHPEPNALKTIKSLLNVMGHRVNNKT